MRRMHARHGSPVRARRLAAMGVAGLLSLAGVAWSGGTAWAASHSPAHHPKGHHHASPRDVHHTHRKDRKDHKHHAPRLPEIGNATTMSAEPVVHATKGPRPRRLEVKNLVVGTGAAVTRASTVTVKYVGANYATGKDFTAATWTSGRATTFPLSGVIPGFAEGLVGMKVGGRREIVIPPRLGYGRSAQGPITANETLVFVVDLEGVKG